MNHSETDSQMLIRDLMPRMILAVWWLAMMYEAGTYIYRDLLGDGEQKLPVKTDLLKDGGLELNPSVPHDQVLLVTGSDGYTTELAEHGGFPFGWLPNAPSFSEILYLPEGVLPVEFELVNYMGSGYTNHKKCTIDSASIEPSSFDVVCR